MKDQGQKLSAKEDFSLARNTSQDLADIRQAQTEGKMRFVVLIFYK